MDEFDFEESDDDKSAPASAMLSSARKGSRVLRPISLVSSVQKMTSGFTSSIPEKSGGSETGGHSVPSRDKDKDRSPTINSTNPTNNSQQPTTFPSSGSIGSAPPPTRTKSQRLKAQNLPPRDRREERQPTSSAPALSSSQTQSSLASESSSSSRRVQFSNITLEPIQEAGSTLQTQTSPSSSQSSFLNQRKRLRSGNSHSSSSSKHTSSWMQDEDSEEREPVTASNPKRTKYSTTQQPQHQHRQLRQSVGLDAFAVQDTGHSQMLQDECIFLCSSIIEWRSSSPSSCLSALEAASNLVQTLSKRNNRHALFFQNPSDNNPALQSLLDLFGTAGMWTCQNQRALLGDHHLEEVEEENQGDSQLSELTTPGTDGVGGTRRSRVRQDAPVGGDNGMPSIASIATSRTLLQAVTIILHFVSLDCTLSEEAASGCANMARRIRRSILSHTLGFQGILRIVMAEPLVSRLRTGGTLLVDSSSSSPSIVLPRETPSTSVSERTGDQEPATYLSVSRVGASSEASVTSASTPDSQSSSGSADPTKAGRQRRRKMRYQARQEHIGNTLSAIPEDENQALFKFKKPASHDDLSFRTQDEGSVTSKDSQLVQSRQRLATIVDQILQYLAGNPSDAFHSCGRCSIPTTTEIVCSSFSLLAVTRIINGKMESDEKSCIDELDQDDEFFQSHSTKGTVDRSSDVDDDCCNPLLITNRMLGENGAVPLLSQAFADTLAALIHQISGPAFCPGCLEWLRDRMTMLVSLVDGACLLNGANRKAMVQEGYTKESGGYLIFGLISVLRSLHSKDVLFDSKFCDITLEALRALTSLTHENITAAKELESRYDPSICLLSSNDEESVGSMSCGLEVLAFVLRKAAQSRAPDASEKNRYDSTIFCLNIFTNALESEATRQLLAELTVQGVDAGQPRLLFLTWLTRWLVDATQSFQDALVESTFGTSPSTHSSRHLVNDENEKLVTAGNGFVLLSCLMIGECAVDGSSNSTSTSTGALARERQNRTSQVRKVILEELPGESLSEKLTFVRNALKAFCNFYHFSVGELSLAVVAPVKSMISKLETIGST